MNSIKLIANFLINDLKGWLNKEKVSENEFYEYLKNGHDPIPAVLEKISSEEIPRKDGLAELKAKCGEICAAIKEKRAVEDELKAGKLAYQMLQREIGILKLDEYDLERESIRKSNLSDLEKNSKITEVYNKHFK